MDLDFIRAEIERMRAQSIRQQRDILDLQKAGVPTAPAIALLERMHATVDTLIGERHRMKGEALIDRRAYKTGKAIHGTPSSRRM